MKPATTRACQRGEVIHRRWWWYCGAASSIIGSCWLNFLSLFAGAGVFRQGARREDGEIVLCRITIVFQNRPAIFHFFAISTFLELKFHGTFQKAKIHGTLIVPFPAGMNCTGRTRRRITPKNKRFNKKNSTQPHGAHGSIGSTLLHRRLINWMLMLLHTRTSHRLSSKRSHGHQSAVMNREFSFFQNMIVV